MTLSVSVQVPIEDEASLHELTGRMECDEREQIRVHPFDGEMVTQVVVPLTLASIPVLKAWILGRADQRKSLKVAFRGYELTGYTPREVEIIIRALEEAVSDESD